MLRTWSLGLLVLAGALALAAGADEVDEKDVLVLTPANFDDTVKKYPKLLVEFYAPWCGHCKQLTPHYAKAATALKKAHPEVGLAKVDADAHKSLGEKFGVQGFPTLKWFVDGEASEYSGGRTEDTIVSWIKKRMGPPAKEISTKDDHDTHTVSVQVVVMGYFTDKESKDAQTFLKLAQDMDEVEFGISHAAEVHTHAGAKDNSIVLYKKFDEGKAVYDGEIKKKPLKDWILMNQLAYVTEFDQDTSSKIFGSPIKTQILFFGDKTDDKSKAAKTAFDEVAKENYGKMVGVYVNKDKNNVLEFFGVEAADVPCVFVVTSPEKGGSMKKYKGPSKEELSAGASESLKKFVTDYHAGSISPHVKSEKRPASDVDSKGVTTLVGTSFDEIVMDENKDVLVEFYAPWCGHCKQLVPIYDKLGKAFESVESVVIAKMDATANDPPEEINVQGFPTIKFFPAMKNKVPQDFEGERTLKGFKKFIKKNAKVPFELPKKKKSKKDEEDV